MGPGWLLLRAVGENLLQVSSMAPGGLLALFGVPWLVAALPHLSLDVHMVFSLCVCVYVHISPFYKDNSHVG